MNRFQICIKVLYLFFMYAYTFNYDFGNANAEGICRNEDKHINLAGNVGNRERYNGKKYNITTKDNNTYLLLFKLSGGDKHRMIFLLNYNYGDDSSISGSKGDLRRDDYGYLINKYSLKSWSKSDVLKLNELYELNKCGNLELVDVNNDYSVSLNGREIKEMNFNSGIGRENVLKINYLKKNLLESSKEVKLFLPGVTEKEKGSSELILYEDRSLSIINNGNSGMSIRQLTNIKGKGEDRFQSSYTKRSNDTDVIRYYKLNKGSFGEVWRGLAFTEYLNKPFGDCEKEREFELKNLNWRRGELVNHELNSLIMDVLNMLNSNFIQNLDKGDDENDNVSNGEKNVIDIVMKKMTNNLSNERVLYSIVREVFFGIVLYCLPHISRFLHVFEESLDEKMQDQNSGISKSNVWLVYRYEGISLSNLLFEINESGSLVPSEFWWKNVKGQSKADNDVIKDILRQIFTGLINAHELGIIHRDIKPSNIFISTNFNDDKSESLYVRIGDWGSAMMASDYKLDGNVFVGVDLNELQEGLYGELGPTEDDETEGFQPPDAQFKSFTDELSNVSNQKIHRNLSYDIWSVGVVMLQMVWGNLEVFSVLNDDTEFQHFVMKVVFHIRQNSEQIEKYGFDLEGIIKDSVYRLSLMRMCLMDLPNNKDETNEYGVFVSELILKSIRQSTRNGSQEIIGITKECRDEYLQDFIKKNDISGIGLEDLNAIKLLKRLLNPRSNKRITAKEVLEHPYFSY